MSETTPEPAVDRDNDDDLPGWTASDLDPEVDLAGDEYALQVAELVTPGDDPEGD